MCDIDGLCAAASCAAAAAAAMRRSCQRRLVECMLCLCGELELM